MRSYSFITIELLEMSVVSSSSDKIKGAALIKHVTALIAEAMSLLGGASLPKKGAKKLASEKTKGTNRGLVKLTLQRKAALAIIIDEWEQLPEEDRTAKTTVTKISKAGKETVKEVFVTPKPTYKDVIALFKKGQRELPEVAEKDIDAAWTEAQAKRERDIASETESVGAEEPEVVAAPAAPAAKKGAAAKKEPELVAAAPPAAKKGAAAKKEPEVVAAPAAPAAKKGGKKEPEVVAAAPAAAAAAAKKGGKKEPEVVAEPAAAAAKKPAGKGASGKEKVITVIKNDEDIDCTVFEFKGKNYIRYPTGHCWSSKKDSDGDWSFAEWAGMWMGNSIDASVEEPQCDEEEQEEE